MDSDILDQRFSNRQSISLIRDRLRGKSILITGANGLIGAALVKLLLFTANKYGAPAKVIATCRSQSKARGVFSNFQQDKHLELLVQDICDSFDLSNINPDYIIHSAGLSHPKTFSEFPVDVIRVNVVGSFNMLELATASHARIVLISSGEVYGENPDSMFAMAENYCGKIDPLLVRSCYPESKRVAETLCASYKAQFKTDCIICRLCYIYGPEIDDNNSRADSQFFRQALAHDTIVLKSSGDQERTYCFVDDAVDGIICAMLNGESGEAYNIADEDSTTTLRDFATTIADAAGVNIVYKAPTQSETAGYSKSARSVLSGKKLRKLGWLPEHTIKDGISKTLLYALFKG